jgi:ubiquinol-cytochrome c reductase cytochrome c subunit
MIPLRLTTLACSATLGVLLAASALLAGQTPAPAAPAQTGDAENGKRLYMKNTCYFCHGTMGQGAGAVGARLGPPMRNLVGFIRYVRRPSGQMPALTDKVISDQEVTDIFAYLRTIPAPEATKDIPLLNQLKDR